MPASTCWILAPTFEAPGTASSSPENTGGHTDVSPFILPQWTLKGGFLKASEPLRDAGDGGWGTAVLMHLVPAVA